MRNSSMIFGITLFVLSAIFTYVFVTKSIAPSINVVVSVVLTAAALAVPSAIAYFYGVKKAQQIPTNKSIFLSAAFALCVGNSTAVIFGLREISWFLFAAVVIAISYLAPVRVFKSRNEIDDSTFEK